MCVRVRVCSVFTVYTLPSQALRYYHLFMDRREVELDWKNKIFRQLYTKAFIYI